MADEQGAIPGGMVRSQAFWDAAQECLRVDELTEFATGVTEEYRNGYKGACKIMSATLQRMSHQVFHELPLHTQIKAADRLTDSGEGLAYWQGYDDGKRAALATPKPPVDAGAMREGGHSDTEGEAMAMFAHLNCPLCAGSGHVEDAEALGGYIIALLSALDDYESDMPASVEDAAGDLATAIQWDGEPRNLPDAGEPLD